MGHILVLNSYADTPLSEIQYQQACQHSANFSRYRCLKIPTVHFPSKTVQLKEMKRKTEI